MHIDLHYDSEWVWITLYISIKKIKDGVEFEIDLSKIKIKEDEKFIDLEKTNLITGKVVHRSNIITKFIDFYNLLFQEVQTFDQS